MSPTVDLARIVGLLTELQDLKRLQPAHLPHSIATELFREAWMRILSGQDVVEVATHTTLAAVVDVLFPGADERFFTVAGLSKSEIEKVLSRALLRTAGEVVEGPLRERLQAAIPPLARQFAGHSEPVQEALPEALVVLCDQPRAGATHPKLPRLVLSPPEMHSDHCLMTAVYAVLFAEQYDADPGTAFLGALAHHLHNAYLPDCGYAGEICLGPYLQQVIQNCRAEALAQFPQHLRPRITAALYHHERIDTPEGLAISAGDVLDRVIDVKWRTRAAAVTDQDILGELDLVHPGPLKDFQTELLSATGLWG